MVFVKKILLLGLSIGLGFIITEGFIRFALRFPVYGVHARIFGIVKSEATQNIWKPYSKYFNVEGGNRTFKRNNIGLPGTDIMLSDSARYIYLLGSSFVEARQVQQEIMASSVFARQIQSFDQTNQVLNLGVASYDPYDCYFRARYFAERYSPELVFLILESDFSYYFPRHRHPLDFTQPMNFGKVDNRLATLAQIYVRNHSAFVNLFAQSIKVSAKKTRNDILSAKRKRPVPSLNDDLRQCLLMFQKAFGTRFICISVSNCTSFNHQVAAYCKEQIIHYSYNDIIGRNENRFNGEGHLNEQGNKILGHFLAKVYEAHR